MGGIDGIANLPLQQLANRTEYLKELLEGNTASGSIGARINEIETQVSFQKSQLAQVTAQQQELQNAINQATTAGGAVNIATVDITIPASTWAANDGDYPFVANIVNADITADTIPFLSLLPASMSAAADCGICPTCETVDGALKVYAKVAPTADISAALTLIAPKGGEGSGGIGELPVATQSALGTVKVGQGLSVKPDGTLSVDTDTVLTNGDLADENTVAQSIINSLKRD